MTIAAENEEEVLRFLRDGNLKQFKNAIIRVLGDLGITSADGGTSLSVNGNGIVGFTTAIVAGTTETTEAVGTLAKTSHATGANTLFVSDGTYWQYLTTPVPMVKVLADGDNEALNVDEVQTISLSAGAAGDTFKLTFNTHASAVVTIPTGGFANVTAAQIKAALITISDWTTNTADISVVKTLNDYAVTFTQLLGWSDVGAITITNKTGAADGSVAETTKGVAGGKSTATGVEVGDKLSDVLVFATKASIATVTTRPASDFEIRADVIGVVANIANNTNNQYLFEYADLTP